MTRPIQIVPSDDQLAMTQLLEEADERARAIRDQHRGRVQRWFDSLPEAHKAALGRYMSEAEWDTCASLSVAACDWHHSRRRSAGHSARSEL
jgi:hypothetical protein